MTRLLAIALALSLAAAAWAQQYKWVDKDGKVRYGDTPPPGVKATELKAPTGLSAPSPPATGAKDAKAGALSPAEQDQAYRKRQIEAQKAREKEDLAAKDASAKKDNCARAQMQLRTLESGQRIALTDSKGERYYMDDSARDRELGRAREQVQQWCN